MATQPVKTSVPKPAHKSAPKPAATTKQNGSTIPWIVVMTIAFLVIIGLIVALVISNSNTPQQLSQPGNQPVAPLTTPVPQTKPTWVEWTVSPISTDNFVVEYGDWNVTTNDLYTFGDRTVDVTIVVKNSTNKIVVINYAGMNWDRGIQVKPGERTTFTGKAGDFRVTLLDYKNQ